MFTLYNTSGGHNHQSIRLEIVENGAEVHLDMSVVASWKVISSDTKREIFNILVNGDFNFGASVTINYANGDYKVKTLREIRGQ